MIGNDTFRGERTVALTATGINPVSAVGWVTTRSGPAYSWNLGQSLARTVNGTKTYLHATYTTDRVSGAWVDDNGPYAGINYVRTSSNGVSFTAPKRLNPAKQHGSRGSLAASGKFVYATWVSTSRWIAYKGTAPRVLYLRRNSNHGSSTAWNTTKRLTSLSGRVDYPTVAAAGSNVYVAYTDSGAGSVRVKISRDRAATWSTVTLGTTSAGSSTAGRYGMPRIAASGNTVIVSWLANAGGAVRARVSTDAGKTWSTTGSIVGTSTDIPAVAASGSRAAVAWTDGSSAVVRTWAAGAWSTPKAVVSRPAAYTQTYGPGHRPQWDVRRRSGLDGLRDGVHTWSSSTRANLVWSELKDNGASWFAGQVLGSPPSTTARRYNDYPSVLWPSATRRHVMWNAGTAGTNNYRIVMRTGIGVVAAATFTAASRTPHGHRSPRWRPVADAAALAGRSLIAGTRQEFESACHPAGAFVRDRGQLTRCCGGSSDDRRPRRRRDGGRPAAKRRLTAARPVASNRPCERPPLPTAVQFGGSGAPQRVGPILEIPG